MDEVMDSAVNHQTYLKATENFGINLACSLSFHLQVDWQVLIWFVYHISLSQV